MVANCARRHLTLILVVIAVCILVGGTAGGRSEDLLRARKIRPILLSKTGGLKIQVHATTSTDPAADDLALILQRLKADFANPNSTYPHDVHGPNFPVGKGWLDNLAPDGHWTDIRYTRPPWTSHLVRLVQMATAYANSSSPDYHSPKILEGVEHGLQYWFDKHTFTAEFNMLRWWNWE